MYTTACHLFRCQPDESSLPILFCINFQSIPEDRDSAVGIANRYGLEGPGIESRWGGRDFSAPVRAHPANYTMGTGSFPGVKRSGRGVGHPPYLMSMLNKE